MSMLSCLYVARMIKMSHLSLENNRRVSKVWIALRRLDKNDDRVIALREVSIPPSAEASVIIEIITTTFCLDCSDVILKIRNHHGFLIPLNNLIPANSKHIPYVLEVAKIFQHVRPKPRTIPMTVLNRSMKTRLQTIDRRIQRLEELLPQIKLRHHEKLTEEIECLSQKLRFLHKRMQVAESRSWKGMLTRAPLW
ncbi:uncharacterized protein si:zfos-1056e6.1 [Cheilinus undulatus]|uniref:uncharacterized protein si:zfos-1056e6.1 n=1 Tax=Cheilinus undulatus TaxID=241271 RepID=UPI001BD5188D|nr:uncharacterized protein si:zfos-1056e6.1 [Cheilinus undulatus]